MLTQYVNFKFFKSCGSKLHDACALVMQSLCEEIIWWRKNNFTDLLIVSVNNTFLTVNTFCI